MAAPTRCFATIAESEGRARRPGQGFWGPGEVLAGSSRVPGAAEPGTWCAGSAGSLLTCAQRAAVGPAFRRPYPFGPHRPRGASRRGLRKKERGFPSRGAGAARVSAAVGARPAGSVRVGMVCLPGPEIRTFVNTKVYFLLCRLLWNLFVCFAAVPEVDASEVLGVGSLQRDGGRTELPKVSHARNSCLRSVAFKVGFFQNLCPQSVTWGQSRARAACLRRFT